jgi:serine/threonine-protein kinase
MKACPECGKRFLGEDKFCPNDGATLQELDEAEAGDPLVGTTVDGRYQIEEKLGEGGMGMVYLARHAVIGNKCALKVLKGELASDGEVSERFIQEARAAAAIGNEHIIQITDFGQLPDGSAYFVMEFLDGSALHDVIEDEGQVDSDRVLDIIIQCCEALASAHNANIVHRDLKPDNIFLVAKGASFDFVKILDFGIAKVATSETGKQLTKTGMIFGTPQYMSPEQAAGTGVDARTDIYSLGIIMYEMLCGHVPFEADTFMGVLTKHLYEEPIPPRRLVPPVEIPQNVEAVLLKAIAKKPEKRYQSMGEFAEDLRSIREGKTPAIVYDQLRETAATTVPPPPPSAVVGGEAKRKAPAAKAGKPKWPLFAGIGAVVVVCAVGAILFFTIGNNGSEAKADTPPQPVAAPEPPPPEPEPEPEPEKAPVLDEDLPSVKLSSDPTGALLYFGTAFMGPLPFEVNKPKKGAPPVAYTIKLDGYKDLDVMVTSSTPDDFKLTLVKEKKGKKKSGSSGGGKKATASGAKSTGSGGDVKTIKVQKKKKKLGDLADPWAN